MELKVRSLTISLPDYLYRKFTRQAQAFDTSLEEIVLFQLKLDEVRNSALVFLQQHAGRCLTVREPIFKEETPPIWVVPAFTNVAQPQKVGEVVVDADTFKVLSTHRDVIEMIKKGHSSFGFKDFPVEKKDRLADLLTLNNQNSLDGKEKLELDILLAEEQALQLQNLETLDKRLLS